MLAVIGAITHARSFNEVPQSYATALGADPCEYPNNCPGQVFPRADKQTWMMNASTIIMYVGDSQQQRNV